jgi:hypothetical protein
MLGDANGRHGEPMAGIELPPAVADVQTTGGNCSQTAPGGIRRFKNFIHHVARVNITFPGNGSPILDLDFGPASFQLADQHDNSL